MEATNLRDNIIDRLSTIKNNQALESISQFIDFTIIKNNAILNLSEDIKKDISIARTQVRNKQTLSNLEANQQVNEWLNK